MKTSEDNFYELKNSTQNLEEQLSESMEERDKLQVNLNQTEQKLKELENITERARELFGSSVMSEKESNEDICGICFEDFDNSSRKRKIFNPCGHAACSICATVILNSGCHICRTSVKNLIPSFY